MLYQITSLKSKKDLGEIELDMFPVMGNYITFKGKKYRVKFINLLDNGNKVLEVEE